jgi:outer membrane protein assembly factor BamB
MNRREWLAAGAAMAVGAPAPAAAETWKQWRGPNRDCVTPRKSAWPTDFSTLKLSWRTPLAEGYPGPIVDERRVYVAETRNKKQEIVRALDRRTGAQLWERAWDGAMSVPFFAKANGDWIRATPLLDGDALFVSGMMDDLYCLSADDGAVRWRLPFYERMGGSPPFGAVCSPLSEGPHLFIQAGNGLAKITKADGKLVWHRPAGKSDMMENGAFSSPIVAEFAGVRQLLVQTRTRLTGVDLESGAALWEQPVPSFRGMNILTPVVYRGGIFTSTYQNKSFFFRPTKSASGWKVETVWENKTRGYMSSPVVVNGFLYLHNQDQRFVCIDLADGKTKWVAGDRFGKYWSMATAGDSMLALDQRGELLLIRANPEKYERLGRTTVSEQETWGHLAVADDEIFIRELRGVAAYRWSA